MAKKTPDELLPSMWCTNGACSMHKITLATAAAHCRVCGRALADAEYDQSGMDTPPLSDDSRLGEVIGSNGKLLTSGTEPKANGPIVFESDCDISGCPVAPRCIVVIPFVLYANWLLLCHKFSTEWMAYLRGEEKETPGGLKTITLFDDGMYFPRQTATSVHVSAEPGSVLPNTIGSVHSHVDMAAFMSAEDIAHFNHPVDLVVNRAGHVKGVMRRKLDCGRYQRVAATVTLLGTEDDIGLEKKLASALVVEKEKQSSTNVYVRGEHGLRLLNEHDGRHSQSKRMRQSDFEDLRNSDDRKEFTID